MPPGTATQTGDYKIGPGDVLRILTWKEADFSGSFPVRFDGKITIPFVGDIEVAGRTPMELKAELEQHIGQLVDVARVSVAIEDPKSARFFVLGKVASQGAFPYEGPLRVAQALALAGGFQDFAKLDQIFVIREERGELRYYPFNYADFVQKRTLTGNLVLLPGDTIVVP
jgi:polysaccharide export outer membrane protein